MKYVFPCQLGDTPDVLMARAGYVRHCTETGKMCYHRQLDYLPFPRFHAYVTLINQGMLVDLHFDAQDDLHHKGNHDKHWAYEGGRIDGEMRRIVDEIQEKTVKATIHKPTDGSSPKPQEHRTKKKSLFEILFKTM